MIGIDNLWPGYKVRAIKRKRGTDQNEHTARSCGKFAALLAGNDTALKGCVSLNPVFVLRNQIFWLLALCCCAIFFPPLRRTVPPLPSRLSSPITLKMKAVRFFETSADITQLHDARSLKIWFLDNHSVESQIAVSYCWECTYIFASDFLWKKETVKVF